MNTVKILPTRLSNRKLMKDILFVFKQMDMASVNGNRVELLFLNHIPIGLGMSIRHLTQKKLIKNYHTSYSSVNDEMRGSLPVTKISVIFEITDEFRHLAEFAML